jgi:uncharacterized membrane protein
VERSSSRRCVRWLRAELPDLVASGTISSDTAGAIDRHYASAESRASSSGFVLLVVVGSALIGAGIILLIAHNWDELSRATRSIIAFLPLLVAQALGVLVLLRRSESPSWRECAAILDVAAVATAISLVSQTYQIQGTLADFLRLWLLLSIPIVYLFRSTAGAIAYIAGTVAWLFTQTPWWHHSPGMLFFWLFLLAILPYYILLLRRNRMSRESTVLSIFLLIATAIGLGFTAEYTRANLGGLAFAGFFAAVYLCGMRFFSGTDERRLHPLALLGGIGVGVTAVVLSFENVWHMTGELQWTLKGVPRAIGIAIELLFPIVALGLLATDYIKRKRIAFSVAAGALPLAAILAWIIANLAPASQRAQDTPYPFAAALIFNLYTLILGIELLVRGTRANSLARANFGLLVIAALAIARFFDSDLSFVTRGVGFIVVGAGFLVANVIFFRRRAAA